MKPALEWIEAVGEAVSQSMFFGANPPGCEVEKIVKAIQKDAQAELLGACKAVLELDEKATKELKKLAIFPGPQPIHDLLRTAIANAEKGQS